MPYRPKRRIISSRRNNQEDYNREIDRLKLEFDGIIEKDMKRFLVERLKISSSAAEGAMYRYKQLEENPNPLIMERISQEVHDRRLMDIGALRMNHIDAVLAYRQKYEDVGFQQANTAVYNFRKSRGLN